MGLSPDHRDEEAKVEGDAADAKVHVVRVVEEDLTGEGQARARVGSVSVRGSGHEGSIAKDEMKASPGSCR